MPKVSEANVEVKAEAPAMNTMATADARQRELYNYYKNETKVKRAVSPLYQPYLGKVMQVALNGITIAFPVDGTQHEVPEDFANLIDSKVMAIDATIKKATKMSNIAENHESYPGELQMF